LIEKINGAYAAAVEETGVVYEDKFGSVKADEAARRRVQEEKNQDIEEQFFHKLDGILTASQKEAMNSAAEELEQRKAQAGGAKKAGSSNSRHEQHSANMKRHCIARICAGLIGMLLTASAGAQMDAPSSPFSDLSFRRHVVPLLKPRRGAAHANAMAPLPDRVDFSFRSSVTTLRPITRRLRRSGWR
jgi:hypothetical protein